MRLGALKIVTVTLNRATTDMVTAEARKRGQGFEAFLKRVLWHGIEAAQSEFATVTLDNAEHDNFLTAVEADDAPGERSLAAAEKHRSEQRDGKAYSF